MLGLTPDPLSAGVGMHVAVAGPYTSTNGSPRGRTVQSRNGKNTRRGFRFDTIERALSRWREEQIAPALAD